MSAMGGKRTLATNQLRLIFTMLPTREHFLQIGISRSPSRILLEEDQPSRTADFLIRKVAFGLALLAPTETL